MNRVLLALLLASHVISHAAPPVVSNVRATQRPGTHYVDIYYNVSDTDGGPVTVYVHISPNGGQTWNVPVFTTSGAVGPGVTLGNDRLIVWHAGVDWPGQFNNQCKVRIVADDLSTPSAIPPTDMVLIPAGPYLMGDTFYEGGADERLPHYVFVSEFFLDKYEVRIQLWDQVRLWGAANRGYSFTYAGSAKAIDHPVVNLSWYDVVKWSNARSEMEGLNPCYYTDSSKTNVYRSGSINITNSCVDWSADGYRLPTEAEWEKAARAGLQGKRFPWGDLISHTNANYRSSGDLYDISSASGYHPAYSANPFPYTSPVGSFPANNYGVFDMAGNVAEWCWDVYDASWYGNGLSTMDDTPGPGYGVPRVVRRGSWVTTAQEVRCAARDSISPSANGDALIDSYGFRCVRRP